MIVSGIAAVLIKQSVVPFVWIIFAHHYGARRAALYLVVVLVIFVLSFAPYLPNGAEAIFNNVVRFSSTGVSSIPEFEGRYIYAPRMLLPVNVLRVLLFGGLAAIPFALKRSPVADKLYIASLWLIVFIPGIAAHYFVFPLVFAALSCRWRVAVLVGSMLVLVSFGASSARGYNVSTAFAWTMCSLLLVSAIRSK